MTLEEESVKRTTEPVEVVSVADLRAHLQHLLSVTLASGKDVVSIGDSAVINEILSQFVSDSSLTALYAFKQEEHGKYTISPALPATSGASTLAVVKNGALLNSSQSLQHQLQVIQLPALSNTGETTAYEPLHHIVEWAVVPYFNLLSSATENGDLAGTDVRQGIPLAKKKIAELELTLRHLYQNTQVPFIRLSAHPIVQDAVASAAAENRRPTALALTRPEILDDTSLMTAVQATTITWRQQIKQITEKDRDPASGTASEEINFWLNMDNVIADIELQLKADAVTLTFDVMAAAKRMGVSVAMIYQDTGLRAAKDKVKSYSLLMRDFPLDELLSATSLEKAADAVLQIFGHLNRRIRSVPYPIARAIPFVEAITDDINTQVLGLLKDKQIMHLTYTDFEATLQASNRVFAAFDDQVKDFITTSRDVLRKRSEKFLVMKINARHIKLQERLEYLYQFRQGHEQLRSSVESILRSNSAGMLSDSQAQPFEGRDLAAEIQGAYGELLNVNVLDISEAGTSTWITAENIYNVRVNKLENMIIELLRARLAKAQTAREMFRVFAYFNSLFVRPKVRGAVQEYQKQLIEEVKLDLTRLHDRYKQQYLNSEAYHMDQLMDLPPISGSIRWIRQINAQLDSYLTRVEAVLGPDWTLYADGQKLYAESQTLRSKLDTKPVFDNWLAEIKSQDIQVRGRIIQVMRNRAFNNKLELVVHFESRSIALFKEVRNMLHLGYTIPHQISTSAKTAKTIYPHAMMVVESVNVLAQLQSELPQSEQSIALLADFQREVHDQLLDSINFTWEDFREETGRNRRASAYIVSLSDSIKFLSERVEALSSAESRISRSLKDLESCYYSEESFGRLLGSIQLVINELYSHSYSNLELWLCDLSDRVQKILADRLEDAIVIWLAHFGSIALPNGGIVRDDDAPQSKVEHRTTATYEPLISEVRFDILLRNQTIHLEPSTDFARATWTGQLNQCVQNVCGLPQLRLRQSDEAKTSLEKSESTFAFLASQSSAATLRKAYQRIQQHSIAIREYYNKWAQFQSLWDLQAEQIWEVLGESLDQWLSLISQIRSARKTFDTRATSVHLGKATIFYQSVQGRVNAKYDTWQKEIMTNFAAKLKDRVQDLYERLCRSRLDLEEQILDTSTTSGAISFVIAVQSCRKSLPRSESELEQYRNSQAVLLKHRQRLPSDWIYVDVVHAEFATLKEIYARKSKSVTEQLSSLRSKIQAEDTILRDDMSNTLEDWSTQKPTEGQMVPEAALAVLQTFMARFARQEQEAEQLKNAREALDITGMPAISTREASEEAQDLMGVWSSVHSVWSALEELRAVLWSATVPRKVRNSLEGLVNLMRELPSRLRQYAAFEHIQGQLQTLLKTCTLLGALKSEAIRERHWLILLKSLCPSERIYVTTLTLGQVWDLKLTQNEAAIRTVIQDAQGELALEEYLRDVRETWTTYTLDLVNYQNKCRLIRGWDEVFSQCSEHLTSLTAMRNSPHFKIFEDEVTNWESRLTRVHLLFDVWIEVQRQWIYLESIFSDNADIKHLLPNESARFQSINGEYYVLMRKVAKTPAVLEVIAIGGAQQSVERLHDALQKIQKALGEYLEKERSQFPRFYFVGDEDLLEIIGNASDFDRIQRHMQKMFPGINSLILSNDKGCITGIGSREGEQVPLQSSIELTGRRVNEWLEDLVSATKSTLGHALIASVFKFPSILRLGELSPSDQQDSLKSWITDYPAQILLLATQCCLTSAIEDGLESDTLSQLQKQLLCILDVSAALILSDLDALVRLKLEALIAETVHQVSIVQKLQAVGTCSADDFSWTSQLRYYIQSSENPFSLAVKIANATFEYGFEYLGVPERIVQTDLTHRCFLTLTQALHQKLGGSPFGPAGTGKTETVKALGQQLGRFVLVFCCDESFDFQAMGRLLLGLCKVGAWGCFDEFNRLDEAMLSAVSQQIQSIQIALRSSSSSTPAQVELIGRTFSINRDSGIFITMNPGYAGRSNLPDNLKKLFRSIAMTKPDKEMIAEVIFYAQGFSSAKQLSSQIVPFFDACATQFSAQAHYDFGLRALKSALTTCGNLKRSIINTSNARTSAGSECGEAEVVVRSLMETILPKLVGADSPILPNIVEQCFPGIKYHPADHVRLREIFANLSSSTSLDLTEEWYRKVFQLQQVIAVHHGVMLVGAAGSGKTQIWSTLAKALGILKQVEVVTYTIDAKLMSKESLYGKLDDTTREWNDGLFTSILRRLVDNLRGESKQQHWIVFDGDIDPEWVENMNSLLDDNKLLTLPNGERIRLPPNARILFEVDSLKHATLATVSRCGMVYFDDHMITNISLLKKCASDLHHKLEAPADLEDVGVFTSEWLTAIRTSLSPYIQEEGIVLLCLSRAAQLKHIMSFDPTRAIDCLFALLHNSCKEVLRYNNQHPDLPLSGHQIQQYISSKLLLHIIWSFAGDCSLSDRQAFGTEIIAHFPVSIFLRPDRNVLDYNVRLPDSKWQLWEDSVPTMTIEPESISATTLVVPTVDTLRHEELLYAWLAEHKACILCGPPGSGKTMTLFSALRKLPELETVGLNFSSATTPELVIKTLEQYCSYSKTMSGIVMAPKRAGRWLVLFCDEINLPQPDIYGTQQVIFFLRQLIEKQGFWRNTDKQWISVQRVQTVAACNPPTDVGRSVLSDRFLRHVPVIMVDYPAELSLHQIYSTFVRAALKATPNMRGFAEPLTSAMVSFYLRSSGNFTTDKQAHYIYSPRELSRWIKGVAEAIRPIEALDLNGLVRIWAHEALRLFSDRLVSAAERSWTMETIQQVAREYFPGINEDAALGQPILYSSWLTKDYNPVKRDDIKAYIGARMRTFCEEEIDVPLIPFDDVVEQVLQIDRVFRQPQGHLILIGISGSGKTTLSKFVAWLNGLSIYQIRVHRKYSAADFDEDLRQILRRCGTKGEKICFLLDESNVLDAGFLERMNTLLANAEVPGLFEGEEMTSLISACKEGAQRDGVMLESSDELYDWFTQQVIRNLHVVFTMNPPKDMASKAATSPALFNRCVLNWFGDWSAAAKYQVASELTLKLDLHRADYAPPAIDWVVSRVGSETYRDAISNALVHFHNAAQEINAKLQGAGKVATVVTPRHYLDLVNHFIALYTQECSDLEDLQRHLTVGLGKLQATVEQVDLLQGSLAEKKILLQAKNTEANDKLQKMVAGQQEAEQKKQLSIEMQTALQVQEAEIAKRQELVMADLSLAEPAVLEAQKSVSNIKKQQLTEVRSMGNPPEAVKLAMESVCTLLGHQVDGWKSVQGVVRREDFISSIVRFDSATQMTPELRRIMQRDYMSLPNFQYEAVNRASKACGPLVQWVAAQVSFSEILDKVGPLREEVRQLEQAAITTRDKATSMENLIGELENSINEYKLEYAELISATQTIKQEMQDVEAKVARSHRLINSLTSERDRWNSSSRTFEAEHTTVVGDAMLAAAVLAYSGYFDQLNRQSLQSSWRRTLSDSGITFNESMKNGAGLASADERLTWSTAGLPVDDLSIENATILERHIRYPVIIDPTGRACDFLINKHTSSKPVVTSFLDDAFIKHLETALRFGGTILIQDAEYMDPVLNRILNKEYHKIGGRLLVELGRSDVDVSPAFRLYLSTRAASFQFSPDVCSRVTFVNFTVTRSSLESQTLHKVLISERPDIEEKRAGALQAQGQLARSLRQLEGDLLRALNLAGSNLLDDEKVISTLERLKVDAAEVSTKIEHSEKVMAELSDVTQHYEPVSQAVSSIFVILQELSAMNHFYQFSLEFLEAALHKVLHRAKGATWESAIRVNKIVESLFISVFRLSSPALLDEHHAVLALSLLLGYCATVQGDHSSDIRTILTSLQGLNTNPSPDKINHMLDQVNQMAPALALEARVKQDPTAWADFLASGEPCSAALMFLKDIDPTMQAVYAVALVYALRPKACLPAMVHLLTTVFGVTLLGDSEYDLEAIIREDVSSTTPIMLASIPGYDASFRVENIVRQQSLPCSTVAMGSAEGITQAEIAISSAAKSGTWVLLKNIHLAASWLGQLTKKIQSLDAHETFRLFLTTETSSKVPSNLIRLSRSFIFEAPPGVRANMLETTKIVPVGHADRDPIERARLYFLLSWHHALVQERLRYAGLGWSKAYEFNDSDFESSRLMVDDLLQTASHGRSNLSPDKIPWTAIKTLITQCFYGGRIDVQRDQIELERIVESIFSPDAFEIGFPLVKTDAETITIPDVSKSSLFLDWIHHLPERQPPTWLGLRPDAHELALVDQAVNVMHHFKQISECLNASASI